MGKVVRHKRNCDRSNSGDIGLDFNNAINKYRRDTGEKQEERYGTAAPKKRHQAISLNGYLQEKREGWER